MNALLKTCALVAPSLLIGALLMGAASPRNETFDTITVKRINIVEPDGTLRMVVSNKAQFPGAFVKGTEHKHERPAAGLLFFNDEGTENGGLIFNGAKDAHGEVSSGVSLTFDRYQQDQQLQLLGVDDHGRHFAGMTINDVADGVERPIFSEQDAAQNKAGNHAITKRMYVGKTSHGDSAIQLADAHGKPRLAIKVSSTGEAEIIFLDALGNVQKTIRAQDLQVDCESAWGQSSGQRCYRNRGRQRVATKVGAARLGRSIEVSEKVVMLGEVSAACSCHDADRAAA